MKNKILFSFLMLCPLIVHSMRHQANQDSSEIFMQMFGAAFKVKTPLKEFSPHTVMALVESQMNGKFTAYEHLNEVKLDFYDIDAAKNKKYTCSVLSANLILNEKVSASINAKKNEVVESDSCDDLCIEKLMKKFKQDPFIDVDEHELEQVQLSRFLSFITNKDIYFHFKNFEDQFQSKQDEFIEVQNSKKLALKKIRMEVEKVVSNRAVLRLALAASNITQINESTANPLHLKDAPYIPLKEYIKNLRKMAAQNTNK